jgi:ribosomal subunit interface protein
MKLIIESPKLDLRQSTEEVVEQKFRKLEKLFDKIDKCEIVIKKEPKGLIDKFFVEAKLFVPGNVLFAKETADSFESAANEVALDLESQLRKYKDKLYEKRM